MKLQDTALFHKTQYKIIFHNVRCRTEYQTIRRSTVFEDAIQGYIVQYEIIICNIIS